MRIDTPLLPISLYRCSNKESQPNNQASKALRVTFHKIFHNSKQ